MDKNLIPRISVIMPVYNCKQYIEESVFSILNQTFKDFELLIIDDCSSDGTFDYLNGLTDARINLIRKSSNTGYTKSLNLGLDLAKGEYIARMDGDDISVLNRFQRQVEFLDFNKDVVCCGSNYMIIDSDWTSKLPLNNDQIILDLMINSQMAHPSVMFRSKVLKDNNLHYSENYEPAEDYKLWTDLIQYGKLANIEDVLLYYRVHKKQTSSVRELLQKDMAQLIAKEHIMRLCKHNVNCECFHSKNILTINDFNEYIEVEKLILDSLKERLIVFNEFYFFNRKKIRLKQSFLSKEFMSYSTKHQLSVLYSIKIYLGLKFYFTYILKKIKTKLPF